MKKNFIRTAVSIFLMLAVVTAAFPAEVFASPVSDGQNSLKVLFYKGCNRDSEYDYVRNVKLKQSVGDLLACFGQSTNSVKVYDRGMKEKVSGYVGTGDTVAMSDASGNILDSLTVIISGDVNGDGILTSTDYLQIKKCFQGQFSLSQAESTAADCSEDGKLTSTDYLQIKQLFTGAAEEKDKGFYLEGEYENNSDITFWYTHSTYKTLRDEAVPEAKMTSYTVHLARNEMEGVQLLLRADKAYQGLSVSVSAFTDSEGNTLNNTVYLEHYFTCGDMGTYPDALEPMPEEFDLPADVNQGIYIRANAEKDTKPGYYNALITLKQGEEVLFRGEIWAHVWDFSLPDATSCKTYVGIDHRYGTYDPNASYKDYYDFVLENYRMNPNKLPYDFTDDRVDEYLDNPKIQNFLVGASATASTNCGASLKRLNTAYSKLSQKQEWMDKSLFYVTDEPSTQEALDTAKTRISNVRSVFGDDAKIIIPMDSITDKSGNNMLDTMKGLVNVWCFSPLPLSTNNGLRRVKEALAEGDEFWGYVACNPLPTTDYLNVFITKQGLKTREIFWELQRNGCNGFLYWSCNYWAQLKSNPWEDMKTLQDTNLGEIYGDGSLLYPGEYLGTPGPVGTIRFECIRDGLDDFDYIEMAKSLGFGTVTDEMIDKVAKRFMTSMNDPDAFAKIRIELGNLIEANG